MSRRQIVILEFAVGVFGSLALGLFIAARSTTTSGHLVAGYILTLGVNYMPLLLHAVALRNGRDAHGEVVDELGLDPR